MSEGIFGIHRVEFMTFILYYLVIKPLSLLPLYILYWAADVIHLVVYRIFGYRKDIVLDNLRNSFPNLSEGDIKKLANKFYKHFEKWINDSPKKTLTYSVCRVGEVAHHFYYFSIIFCRI